MSLRAKIVWILSAIVLSYAGLDYAVQRAVVLRSFVALEEHEAEEDIRRVVEAFDKEVERVDARCLDWASREDTIRYVERPSAEFEAAYLGLANVRENDLDLLFILDARGIAVWSRILHPSGRDIELKRSLPKGGLSPTHPLLRREPGEERSGARGLFLTEEGPMLVSSRPIVAGGHEGAVEGHVIMGRFVDDELIAAIEKATAVDFELRRPPDESVPEDERRLWNRVAGAPIDPASRRPAPVVEPRDDAGLDAFATIEDVKRAPGVLVRANIPRDITRRGGTSMRYALLSTVAAGLLIMLVMLLVLQRTVLTPIAALTRHAVRIGREEDFTVKLGLQRKDEVGILSREFDDMVEKLAQSRAALVETARAAGMSEIATGVLHNVGNVLNSVNVSASLIAEKARRSSIADLARTMQVVADHSGDLARFIADHPKGRHLHPLLTSLTSELCGERDAMLREIGSLSDGIDHIKRLVQSQQSYARRSGVLETVALAEVLETALSLSGQAEGEPAEIEVAREYEELPQLTVDRHRTLEILVNLIRNARQSLAECGKPRPRLTLRLARAGERVRIEVADDGVGIPQENLARIFAHGFTTKKGGHGFGLHASACAATEMGGSVSARSDGPGRGATFALEIPVQKGTPVPALP